MPETLYLAVNNSTHHGFALGDTVCAVGMAWKFIRNDRPDKVILSLNRRGGDFNFLWDRFIRENKVEVVMDDFCPNNMWEKYGAFDYRRKQRKVQGRQFDIYREINVRTESGTRQNTICGEERGLNWRGTFGPYNLWTYYYCGQESYKPRPTGLHDFTDDLIDHDAWTPAPRSLFLAPHAKCQGNDVFTLDFWTKVVKLLLDNDSTVKLYLNTNHGHFDSLKNDRLEKGFHGQPDLFKRIPRYGAVACGNTGVGWVTAACGVPLFAMQHDESYFEDFRYEWCGVRSLKRFFRFPKPMMVAQALLDHLDGLEIKKMSPITLGSVMPAVGFLDQYIPEAGNVAVDVGCGDGAWAKVLASRFAFVEVVEPQIGRVEAVKKLALQNTKAHHLAAWSNNGEVLCRRHVNSHGEEQDALAGIDHHIVSKRITGQFPIASRALDCMGLKRPIDFVKINVGGAEIQAILGAQGILRNDKPALLIKTNNNENRAFLMAYLPKLGYAPQLLESGRVQDESRWTDERCYIYAPRPK